MGRTPPAGLVPFLPPGRHEVLVKVRCAICHGVDELTLDDELPAVAAHHAGWRLVDFEGNVGFVWVCGRDYRRLAATLPHMTVGLRR